MVCTRPTNRYFGWLRGEFCVGAFVVLLLVGSSDDALPCGGLIELDDLCVLVGVLFGRLHGGLR